MDVLAHEAREVEPRRREADRERRGERRHVAELPAKEEREEDRDRAGHGDGDVRDVVADAEEQVRQRDDVELDRPVVDGVVAVAVPRHELPREPGVQALVVVEGLLAELHQPEPEPERGERRVRDGLAPPRRGPRPDAGERLRPAARGRPAA